MRIAIAGGTGVVGAYAAEAATAAGHDVVVLSRRRGVDVVAGTGLAAAMQGVEAVIDTVNVASQNRVRATEFFTAAASRLQRVGAEAGVRHMVTLSIVGIDDVPYGYYQAKLAHEQAAMSGSVPVTIARATQFHEFPSQVLAKTRRGPIALMVRGKSQPVAAREVGRLLVQVAAAPPSRGTRIEVAGPAVEELPEMARRLLAARGSKAWVIPIRLPGAAGRAMRNGSLLPSSSARIIGPTFDEWLDSPDAQLGQVKA